MADDDGEAGRITTLEKIEEKLDKLWEMVTGGGKNAPAAPDPPVDEGVAGEIRRELARLKADEDAQRQRDSDADARMDAKIAEKVPERPPREYRRATRLMRWDTEADR